MNRSCRGARALLGRPREATSEAERLVVEQHLAGCQACRQLSYRVNVMRDVVLTVPAELSASARERVLERALMTLEQPRARLSPAPRASTWWVAAAAACLLLGGWWFAREQPAPLARAPMTHVLPGKLPAAATAPTPAPAAAPADGPAGTQAAREVAAADVPNPQGPSVKGPPASARDASWHRAERDESLTFEHARVEVEHDSELRFSAAEHTLELQRGRVVVIVDPKPHKPFFVQTHNFRVQVLGTEFTVTPDHVEVDHGHVVVRNLQGIKIADLRDGKSMDWPHRLPRDRSSLLPPAEAAGKVLAEARAALARGQVEQARSLIARGMELASARDDLAEAGTLTAECALVAGDPARALAVYERVAKRYADLAAGENALFAAAQLSERVQGQAAAERAYGRYLRRYPHGRFADEARARVSP